MANLRLYFGLAIIVTYIYAFAIVISRSKVMSSFI